MSKDIDLSEAQSKSYWILRWYETYEKDSQELIKAMSENAGELIIDALRHELERTIKGLEEAVDFFERLSPIGKERTAKALVFYVPKIWDWNKQNTTHEKFNFLTEYDDIFNYLCHNADNQEKFEKYWAGMNQLLTENNPERTRHPSTRAHSYPVQEIKADIPEREATKQMTGIQSSVQATRDDLLPEEDSHYPAEVGKFRKLWLLKIGYTKSELDEEYGERYANYPKSARLSLRAQYEILETHAIASNFD